MNVIVIGGTGVIGRPLVQSLVKAGHRITLFSRSPDKYPPQANVQIVGWDGRNFGTSLDLFAHADAVINLAGESLASWPWTAARKQRFVDSRIKTVTAIVQALRKIPHPPKVLLQASAIGFYGPQDGIVTENDPAGNDFGAKLCREWEAASQSIERMGVRRVLIRSAVVLSAENKILKLMALPVRLFVGGPLGSGRQGFSWIHIDDEVAAIRFLLENKRARGPFNLSAPAALPSAAFIREIARLLHRPFWFPMPSFLLKLVLGEMSTLVLDGQYIYPGRLVKMGFRFQFENANAALSDLLG